VGHGLLRWTVKVDEEIEQNALLTRNRRRIFGVATPT